MCQTDLAVTIAFGSLFLGGMVLGFILALCWRTS
jgi:hypothetical protein